MSTLASDGFDALAIATLDERRFAIARVDTSGTAFCPDCVGLEPSQCPDVCTRSIVSVSVHGTDGTAGEPSPIATVFLPSSEFDVAWVDVVSLGVDRVSPGRRRQRRP